MISYKIILVMIFCLSSPALSDDSDELSVETVDESDFSSNIPYESPVPQDKSSVYFSEHFDDAVEFEKNWVKSQAKKEDIEEEIAKYNGEWAIESPLKGGLRGDLGLVLKSKAKHSAIASKLFKPFTFDKKPLVVQYEVLLQAGQECGGSYLKLLSGSSNLSQFHDKTPYSIMFGPDKCGNDHKLHFIFKHKNPLNGSITEKHAKKPSERLDEYFTDRVPHLYTLILRPDNSFEIQVDQKVISSGNLLKDFDPPVNPPETVPDPEDKKPENWDDREKIPDPTAVKPDDWDENEPQTIVDESAIKPIGWLDDVPELIPDSNAEKPADWDVEVDGEWEPPLIANPACEEAPGCGPWTPPTVDNPKYKGKWKAPMIENPNYKGKWKAREIPNPDYFNDAAPFKMQTVTAVGFELWTMSMDILFDNILITDSLEVAQKWAADTFEKKRQKLAADSESVLQKVVKVTNEYPLLWVLYIAVVVIVALIVLYLCQKPSPPTGGGEADEVRKAGEKKKTDEPTGDVKEDAETTEDTKADDEYAEKHSDEDEEEEEEEEGETVEDVANAEDAEEKETTRKRKVRKE